MLVIHALGLILGLILIVLFVIVCYLFRVTKHDNLELEEAPLEVLTCVTQAQDYCDTEACWNVQGTYHVYTTSDNGLHWYRRQGKDLIYVTSSELDSALSELLLDHQRGL